MPGRDPALHFVIQMALRNALKLVRGLRKQISEAEESVMAGKLLDEIALSNYQLVQGKGVGHVFAAPTGQGPKPETVIRDAVVRAQRALAAYLDPGEADKEDPKAAIKALLGILDNKALLRALAATDDARPASEAPPGI